MTEQWVAVQAQSTGARSGKLAAPLLYLSSAEAGWEGLVAQAYREPIELESWISVRAI